MSNSLHIPVLLDSVVDIFNTLPKKSHRIIVDATVGLGGHMTAIARYLSETDILIAFDRDKENLELAKNSIDGRGISARCIFIHANFSSLQDELQKIGIHHIDFILYDLGVSSVHYDDGSRGFSLRFHGPLDMRFDRSRGKTATDLVMNLEASELSRIFTLYGEEKKSWYIANAIVQERKKNSIDTTDKLLTIIRNSSFDSKSPVRVFQALRIAVNEEFFHIEKSLLDGLALLNSGGIMLVITFHSLEDRLVKGIFDAHLSHTIDEITGHIKTPAKYRKYTKKPIIPKEEEIQNNPRSRSAKMRVIQKI